MDLISRQEAIEALAEHIMESALMDNPTTASTDIDSYRPIAELPLRDVPSVHPEKMQLSKEDATKSATFDCISRQAAIDAVKQHMNNVSGGNDEYYIAHRHIIELLQIVPTAEPESRREWYMRGYRDAQPRWIPIKWHDCTAEEREEYGFGEEIVAVFDCDMPSDNQEILVTTSHGYVEKDVCYIDDGYSLDSGYDWIEDITAWMPKPEPYKEGQDE